MKGLLLTTMEKGRGLEWTHFEDLPHQKKNAFCGLPLIDCHDTIRQGENMHKLKVERSYLKY